MEIATAETFIYQRLKATITDGVPIAATPYPEGEPLPAVLYKHMSGTDVQDVSAQIVFTPLQYQVVAQAVATDTATLDTLVRLIHLALHGKGGSNSAGKVFSSRRVRPISMPYRSESGVLYQLAGGIYEISVRGDYGT